MFKSIKAWWNRTDTKFENLEKLITDVQSDKQKVDLENKELKEKTDQLASELEAIRTERESDASKKNSDVPWVDVHSAEFDPARGVQIDLDWNPAFIVYLKENGLKGKTEEIIIQKWLAFLYEDLVAKLEDETVEESVAQVKQPSEFQ